MVSARSARQRELGIPEFRRDVAKLSANWTPESWVEEAIARIRDPFEQFQESLNDDQRSELAALNELRAPFAPKVPAAQSCAPPDVLPWPAADIEAKLHLNDQQREANRTKSGGVHKPFLLAICDPLSIGRPRRSNSN